MTQLALKWVFVLDGDYAWPSGRSFAEDCAFEDSSGKRRLEIRKNGEIKVLAGYAWDGCTPKFSLWDICVGTPDGVPNANTKKPKAYYASLLHDALYQFSMQGLPAPIDRRKEIDGIFLELPTRDAFAPANGLLLGGQDLRGALLPRLHAPQAPLQRVQGPALVARPEAASFPGRITDITEITGQRAMTCLRRATLSSVRTIRRR